jgi:hypothetical protein
MADRQREDAAVSAGIRHWQTRLAGATSENKDGSSCQEAIARCRPMERLALSHEHNAYDPFGVNVCRENGERVGRLNPNLSEEIVKKAKSGYRFLAFVKEVTGGAPPNLAVSALLLQVKADVPESEVREYLRRLTAVEAPAAPAAPRRSRLKTAAAIVLVLVILLAALAAAYLYLRQTGQWPPAWLRDLIPWGR